MFATVNCSLPLVPLLTLPHQHLVAADHVVMCSALVFAAELGSHSRRLGQK